MIFLQRHLVFSCVVVYTLIYMAKATVQNEETTNDADKSSDLNGEAKNKTNETTNVTNGQEANANEANGTANESRSETTKGSESDDDDEGDDDDDDGTDDNDTQDKDSENKDSKDKDSEDKNSEDKDSEDKDSEGKDKSKKKVAPTSEEIRTWKNDSEKDPGGVAPKYLTYLNSWAIALEAIRIQIKEKRKCKEDYPGINLYSEEKNQFTENLIDFYCEGNPVVTVL